MGFVTIPGGLTWPQYPFGINSETSNATSLIDATGEKVAFIGRVNVQGGGPVDITRVGFRFDAVTKAGGSGLTVSLQNVSTSAGPPAQPDETQDQTVAIANGDAGFASNLWYRTGALSANRTVTHGDLLAVVIEFDGGGRLGADAVSVNYFATAASQMRPHNEKVVLKSGGTWATQSGISNVILEDTLGNFHTFFTAVPYSDDPSIIFDFNPADEYGVEFTVPTAMKVNGAWAFIRHDASDVDAVWSLYDSDGTTVLATNTLDGNQIDDITNQRLTVFAFDPIILRPGRTYRMGLTDPVESNFRLTYFTVADAGHLACYPGGTSWKLAHRVGAGAWDAGVSTSRPIMGLYVSHIWGQSPAQLINSAGLIG